jgi:hypothetical protein
MDDKEFVPFPSVLKKFEMLRRAVFLSASLTL